MLLLSTMALGDVTGWVSGEPVTDPLTGELISYAFEPSQALLDYLDNDNLYSRALLYRRIERFNH